jgi:hypothetical protein
MLPQLAQGEANKIFVIPSEFTQALGNIGGAVSRAAEQAGGAKPPPPAPPPPPAVTPGDPTAPQP